MSGSRQRMVDSAITLLRERGAGGFSVDAVLAHSGAPRGSVYHHFPGGRAELIHTAVEQAGAYITHAIDKAAESGDPQRLLRTFAAFWDRSLRDSDYQAGCPILALAVDGVTEADLVRMILTTWQERFTALLRICDLPEDRARRLAALCIAAIEGAIVLCRVERTTRPLEEIVTELSALLPNPSANE